MLTWKRERVRNFSKEFADAYADTLVSLDGRLYEQARFFERLAATGIVKDVPDHGNAAEKDEARAKKWDTYNNKIREWGMGFVERRAGGPSIWRASPMAYALHEKRLSHREFVAVQMTRTQVPTPVMPLRGVYEQELAGGVWERPLRVTLQALDDLRAQAAPPYLSEEEFGQLQRVDAVSQLATVLAEVLSVRAGASPSSAWLPRNADVDIWFNELSYTGYVRRVWASGAGLPGSVIVPHWSRLREARTLDDALPMRSYTDDVEVNAFHDFFCSLPRADVIDLLRAEPEVVVLDLPGDAVFDSSTRTLKGHFALVGGLEEDDSVVIRGGDVAAADAATVFVVDIPAEKSSSADVEVIVSTKQRRMGGDAIVI